MEFSLTYLKKCISAKDELDSLHMFKEGEYFHHPTLMNKDEVKTIKCRLGDKLLTDDPIEEYPMTKCVWIPTVQQLKEWLDSHSWNLARKDYQRGEEHLLDKIMESRREMKWNSKKEMYVKLKEEQ